MKSLHAGTYWGIPVKIHWTFSLLFLVLMGLVWANGERGLGLFAYGMFVILMFVCVILHEFGHALAARRYGVKTVDIIISPIGGLARLQKLPEKPIQELIVAIAGPMVNLIIASGLILIFYLTFSGSIFFNIDLALEYIDTPRGFISLIILINCALFLFNLIPAFPTDGGRILRAFLAMHFGKVRGTQYASVVGRIFAIGFVIFGLMSRNIILVFIGGFVFLMARRENEQMIILDKLSKANARDIMNLQFTRLHLSSSLEEVYQMYIRGGERNYLVFDSLDNVCGVVPEAFIRAAFNNKSLDRPVSSAMSNALIYAESDQSLDKLLRDMDGHRAAIAVIKKGDQILGVLDRQMLFNFIQLQTGK